VIILVIAFLLLILAPWLYYLLNPPHPRPQRQAPGKTILVQHGESLPRGAPGVADAKAGTQYPCD
jgi:hypothetical protein